MKRIIECAGCGRQIVTQKTDKTVCRVCFKTTRLDDFKDGRAGSWKVSRKKLKD